MTGIDWLFVGYCVFWGLVLTAVTEFIEYCTRGNDD